MPVSHLRLAQNLHAVRDRLDAGIGAAAQAVGAEKSDRHGHEPERAPISRPVSCTALVTKGGISCACPTMAVDDHDRVGHEEREEDRHEHRDRLLHAAQIEHDQHTITASTAAVSFHPCKPAGSKLKIASVPLAIEMAIVST